MDKRVALARLELRREREQRRWEREKILYDRLLNPNVVRIALAMGIIAYSTYITRSNKNEGPVQSALALALPGIGLPLLAADAGITDKYALAAISAAGLGYAGLSAFQGMPVQSQLQALAGINPVWSATMRGAGWLGEQMGEVFS